MKKKIFATITVLIIVLSVFASVPVMADEATTEIGGLDFYSITINYDKPILTGYYETKIRVQDENGKYGNKSVAYFFNPEAETDEEKYLDSKGNPITSSSLVIPAGTRSLGAFTQLSSSDGSYKNELFYAKVPYANAFITHIVNSSGICTDKSVDLFGITDPYDDMPYVNKNPNLKYADDGYALATETYSNGNNLKIDVNGYLVDSTDYIWRTADDGRIELYTAVPVLRKTGAVEKDVPVTQIFESDTLEWVPYNERFDENGKIKDIGSIKYQYMLSTDEYEAFLADESRIEIPLKRASSNDEYKNAPKQTQQLVYVKTYRVDSTKDPATFFNTDRVFTADDIEKDSNGNYAFGSPWIGTPVIDVTIKSVTVEIDALGTQLYDDVASDPQQNNIITVSINDTAKNAATKKAWYESGVYTEEEYNKECTFTLGSAKSVTTKTSITMDKNDYKKQDEYGYSPTVKSVTIDAPAELLAKIPESATIYIEFSIAQQQPEAAFDATFQEKMLAKDSTDKSTLLTEKVTILTDADKPIKPTAAPVDANDTSFPTWAIIAIIAGAVVLVAVVVVIIIITSKKKNKEQ